MSIKTLRRHILSKLAYLRRVLRAAWNKKRDENWGPSLRAAHDRVHRTKRLLRASIRNQIAYASRRARRLREAS